MSDTTTPPGVVGIFIDGIGRVVESVSDFERAGYGGFTLRKSQEYRVKRRLALQIVRSYCSEMMHPALDVSDCERFVERLCRDGANVVLIPIGHGDEKCAPPSTPPRPPLRFGDRVKRPGTDRVGVVVFVFPSSATVDVIWEDDDARREVIPVSDLILADQKCKP
jgi:hypothetical protein